MRKQLLNFALIGTGRIGKIHAAHLTALHEVKLKWVCDIDAAAAQQTADAYNTSTTTIEVALHDPEVDAVVIATPTTTHANWIIAAAKAGKAIFCEKPIDLTIERTRECLALVNKLGIPMTVGFNRRFDPHFQSLLERVRQNEIGTITQLIITSRDPAPPSLDYLKESGGIFKDMSIHDFDTARWILGEEPIRLFATASCMQSTEIAALGDYEQTMIVLETPSGKLCHINNNRYSSYGYDQRIEVHGSKGRLVADNPKITTVEMATSSGIMTDKVLPFFLERYRESYKREMEAFVASLLLGETPKVTPEEGLRALLLAEAALLSLKNRQIIDLKT